MILRIVLRGDNDLGVPKHFQVSSVQTGSFFNRNKRDVAICGEYVLFFCLQSPRVWMKPEIVECKRSADRGMADVCLK